MRLNKNQVITLYSKAIKLDAGAEDARRTKQENPKRKQDKQTNKRKKQSNYKRPHEKTMTKINWLKPHHMTSGREVNISSWIHTCPWDVCCSWQTTEEYGNYPMHKKTGSLAVTELCHVKIRENGIWCSHYLIHISWLTSAILISRHNW